MSTDTAVSIGSEVRFTGTGDKVKVAFVVATPETESLQGYHRPDEGRVHLAVHGLHNGLYIKHNVPEGQGAGTFTTDLSGEHGSTLGAEAEGDGEDALDGATEED